MQAWQSRLTNVLNEKRWSYAQLARAAGVTDMAVSGWIGKRAETRPIKDLPSMTMFRVCRALEIRPQWLMFGEGPRDPADEWPFSTSLARVQELPLDVRALLDRILIDVVEIFPTRANPIQE